MFVLGATPGILLYPDYLYARIVRGHDEAAVVIFVVFGRFWGGLLGVVQRTSRGSGDICIIRNTFVPYFAWITYFIPILPHGGIDRTVRI